MQKFTLLPYSLFVVKPVPLIERFMCHGPVDQYHSGLYPYTGRGQGKNITLSCMYIL